MLTSDLVMNLLTLFHIQLALALMMLRVAMSCNSSRGPMRRRGPKKILPLIYKQHEPNFSERSLAASGLPEGPISRQNKAFRGLVPNYNPDIIFKDEEGTGADRIMTQRCKEKLNTLAISVMNQWPGVRLRVTEGWDEENHHAKNSLHYEGRAVDLTTNDRDRSKYGLLASLAVEAGFDWVYYESRSHVHASCKAESAHPSQHSGCFAAESSVLTESGQQRQMSELRVGDRIQTVGPHGGLEYSEVIMFLDREPDQTRRFVRLTTAGGSVLTLTATHLVHKFVGGCDSADCMQVSYAGSLEPGHRLAVAGEDGRLRPEAVAAVEAVTRSGVYAPLTRTGNLVVDGVLSSCYAVIDSQTLAHAAFGPVRWYVNFKENAAHLWRSVSRPLGSGAASPTAAVAAAPRTGQVTRAAVGVHWYPRLLYSLASYLLPSHLQ